MCIHDFLLIYVCISIYIRAYMYLQTQIHLYTYMYICVYVYVYIRIYMYVYMYMDVYMYTSMHEYVYVNAYIYTKHRDTFWHAHVHAQALPVHHIHAHVCSLCLYSCTELGLLRLVRLLDPIKITSWRTEDAWLRAFLDTSLRPVKPTSSRVLRFKSFLECCSAPSTFPTVA